MRYNFCGLQIEVKDCPAHFTSQYDSFRIETCKDYDIFIDTQFHDESEKFLGKPIFGFGEWFKIDIREGIEYRYYINAMTGLLRAVSIDDSKEKVFHVYNDNSNELFLEGEMFNVLGLEKDLYKHGRFILHSSFINTDKGAILFTAPSGTGKSTQADLWHKYRGSELVNGDRTGVWKEDNKWMAGGIPWCGTSGIMKNEVVPLRAIVILKQGLENTIEHLNVVAKAGRLIEQTTINPWNKDMYDAVQRFWLDLCCDVPVLQLSCRPDEGAVVALENELRKYEHE